jgi:hypothetical protein
MRSSIALRTCTQNSSPDPACACALIAWSNGRTITHIIHDVAFVPGMLKYLVRLYPPLKPKLPAGNRVRLRILRMQLLEIRYALY